MCDLSPILRLYGYSPIRKGDLPTYSRRREPMGFLSVRRNLLLEPPKRFRNRVIRMVCRRRTDSDSGSDPVIAASESPQADGALASRGVQPCLQSISMILSQSTSLSGNYCLDRFSKTPFRIPQRSPTPTR